MKNKLLSALLCCFALSTSTGYAANAEDPSYLFIQTAKSGGIVFDTKKNNYRINLSEVDPWVIYFSNAPEKSTSLTTTENFIKSFKKSIALHHDGLNAGIVAIELKNHKMVSYTVTLLHPQYNKMRQTASYTFRPLPGVKKELFPDHIKFKHVALFIDACADCGGSGF